jgi:transcriptional regulator CtsR
VKVNVKRKPLKSSLRRPLLITLFLIWSFCIAPVAQADTVILTNPSNLVAITISNSQIHLTWTDNASNEIGYTVERRTGSGSYMVIANLIPNSTTYTDSILTSGTVYTYRVMALGNGSNVTSSGYSGEASATTGGSTSSGSLATPGNLVATPSSTTQVNLTWIDYASGESGYIVERAVGSGSFSVLGYLSPNSQSFPDTGLTYNTTYTYRVQARGDGITTTNSAYSNSATVTIGSTSSGYLPAPTNLTASAVSQSQINLTWTDNAVSEVGYIIERKVGNGSFEITAYLSSNSQSFSDTAVSAYTTYTYRVYARGDGSVTNKSNYSNEASATAGSIVSGSLATPTGLTATAVTSSQVNLAWTDNANDEIGYNVERATGNTSTFSLLAYLGPNAQSFSDTGLIPNTTYIYRVQARGSLSNSAYSNEASINQGNQLYGALTPPAYIIATAVSDSQINLAWTDNSTGESGYNVERKTGDGVYSVIAYLAPDVQSYSDQGLQGGTTCTYRIQARGNGTTIADSTYSIEASATTTGTTTSKTTVLRFYIGRMYYYLNDEGQFMDSAPVLQSNRTLLPITYAALPLGVEVDWNQKEQKVTLTRSGKVIELWVGKNTATINGEKQNIDTNTKVVPTVVNGRTMLPLSFVAQALDCQVDWDAATQEVKITYPKP